MKFFSFYLLCYLLSRRRKHAVCIGVSTIKLIFSVDLLIFNHDRPVQYLMSSLLLTRL